VSSSLQQDYHLSLISYKIQRLFELRSGLSLYAEVGGLLDRLSPLQLQTIFTSQEIPELTQMVSQYLLSRHFEPFQLNKLPAEIMLLTQPFVLAFVPALIVELEELLRQSKLSNYLLARNILLREIHFLQELLGHFQIQVAAQEVKRQFLFSQASVYLALLRSPKGSSTGVNLLYWQLLNDYGWIQRWQSDSQSMQQPIIQRISPKQDIANYKLSETGKLLYAALEPLDMLSEAFNEALHHHFSQRLKLASVPQINSELEKELRELSQVVMQLAVRKHPAVEKITAQLISVASHYLSQDSSDLRVLVLFTLAQEQVLGTQNLKYRLNDSTRGMAVALARVMAEHPDWRSDLAWVLAALLDGVLEIYESFNLADNALRSFIEAYIQEKEQVMHLNWEKRAPSAKALIAQFSPATQT
jgi:hypothetical protein